MDKRVYIINYKETTIDNDNVMNVESGSFSYAYDNLEEAKRVLIDIAQRKVDDFDEDCEIGEHWSDNDEYFTLTFENDTYEYYVQEVVIYDRENFEKPF